MNRLAPDPDLDGYVDLHCHYLPGVDDGVRTIEEGQRICHGLAALGYSTVAATPHIRSGMFPNVPDALRSVFADFAAAWQMQESSLQLCLGAEHFFDDLGAHAIDEGRALPYGGGKAVLIELPPDRMPLGLPQQLFRWRVRGLQVVLAHPERYNYLHRSTDGLLELSRLGALPLLDLMSLCGKYGRAPRQCAERWLERGLYYAACSDLHRPSDLEILGKAIERLVALQGGERSRVLLGEHPRRIVMAATPDNQARVS